MSVPGAVSVVIGDSIDKIPFERWGKINGAGVYAIIAGGKVLYVGQSGNLGYRLQQHRDGLLTFNLWHWYGIRIENCEALVVPQHLCEIAYPQWADDPLVARRWAEAEVITNISPDMNCQNRDTDSSETFITRALRIVGGI